MIATLLRIWSRSLRRDRVALAMTFILPVAFFSIFASVFGRQGFEATTRIRVLVVDEDRSAASTQLIAALGREGGLRVMTSWRPRGTPKGTAEAPLDRARAQELVRGGSAPVALILPAGFDSALARMAGTVDLLEDPADPVAPQMVNGLLQKAVMTAMPDRFAKVGFDMFQLYAGGFTPEQKQKLDAWLPQIRRYEAQRDSAPGTAAGGASSDGGGMAGFLKVRTVEVVGDRRENGMVSFYAAGMAVMFLLFSASAAGGSLLEEVESGTLDRVLGSRLGMNGLLLGKWLYVMLLGALQLTVMFLWGMAVFHLDLLHHLPGFAVMTLVTASATAGFGLVLATACRTRAQLSSIATIIILCSSALGGSMFPRFLMSESMQKIGLITFNAWALDGFIKVFWRNAPLVQLLPQVGVLLAFGAVFLTVARLLARRWEAA
jgi:ABC-2 type transport system permease protein